MKFRLAGLIVLMLIAAYPVLAQDADDSDAQAIVIRAVDNLAEGYQYTLDWNNRQHLTAEAEVVDVFTQQSITGEVTAGDDYSVTVEMAAADTVESVVDSPSITMQQIRVGGELYISLSELDPLYGGFFADVETGWHRYADLLAQFGETTAQRIAFEGLTSVRLPADFPLTDNLILSVTELEPEAIDGIDMRVFEVGVDALQVMISQMPMTPEERIRMALEAADFFAKSELRLTYTLWIGAEDGQLYRGESAGYTLLPYLTEEEPGPPYDLKTETSAEFTISQHGEIVEIEIPAEVAALMREN